MDIGFNDTRIKSSLSDAEKYTLRKPSKHRAEMKLILKAILKLENINTILDAPCGVGRASIMLSNKGYTTTGIDAGSGAITKAKEIAELNKVNCIFKEADLRKIPYKKNSFDAVLCFRFFHHLKKPQAKQQIISQLCQASRKYVLISYLSPVSITSIKRNIREWFGGRKSSQKTTSLKELESYFNDNNYVLMHNFAQFPVLHTLHLAAFIKQT